MKASEICSKDWWTVVMSMPLSERLEQLHSAKASLIEKYTYTNAANAVSPHINRLNTEIKTANKLVDNSTWQRAARNVLTEEQFANVLVEKRRLEESCPVMQEIKRRAT